MENPEKGIQGNRRITALSFFSGSAEPRDLSSIPVIPDDSELSTPIWTASSPPWPPSISWFTGRRFPSIFSERGIAKRGRLENGNPCFFFRGDERVWGSKDLSAWHRFLHVLHRVSRCHIRWDDNIFYRQCSARAEPDSFCELQEERSPFSWARGPYPIRKSLKFSHLKCQVITIIVTKKKKSNGPSPKISD